MSTVAPPPPDVAAPSQTAALIVNSVQTSVFLLLGPFVSLYGPSIFRIVTLIRSLFAVSEQLRLASLPLCWTCTPWFLGGRDAAVASSPLVLPWH